MPEITGWIPGDFDDPTRVLWWEVVVHNGREPIAPNGTDDHTAHTLRIALSLTAVRQLMRAYDLAGLKVEESPARALDDWMPASYYTVYTVDTETDLCWIQWRLMNPGEHERGTDVPTAAVRAERELDARRAPVRERTAQSLARLGDEVAAMKRRAGVVGG